LTSSHVRIDVLYFRPALLCSAIWPTVRNYTHSALSVPPRSCNETIAFSAPRIVPGVYPRAGEAQTENHARFCSHGSIFSFFMANSAASATAGKASILSGSFRNLKNLLT
jgi:hypothetical protein